MNNLNPDNINPDADVKQWVDNASYTELLSKWRFAPIGDRFFQNDNGKYYSMVMQQKHNEVGNDAHVQASKSIGWD